ncbi:MAG TPA: type II secretion system minor pseudopilin GspK [Steroidobacteraceae bacterium]|nr:type II secretion system minor pseudopilin GspK [Steroidobacteraceae bacterium]
MRTQRGMAMLVAVLLVALATILASAIAYDNAMTARRGTATLDFDEALLVAQGAEAFAAYGIREVDRSNTQPNYPGEHWDDMLGPVEAVPGVMLTAYLEDMEGRFNVNWLIDPQTGVPNAVAVAAFRNLLKNAQIEDQWADKLVDWLDADSQQQPDGGEDSLYLGQDPPYLAANELITSTSELLALPGFGRERYMKLKDYISALPPTSLFNVCTAPGPVLDAFAGADEWTRNADALRKNRETAGACFPTLQGYQQTFTVQTAWNTVSDKFLEKKTSQYFRLTSLVTIGSTQFTLYSLLFVTRTPPMVKPIMRSYTPD